MAGFTVYSAPSAKTKAQPNDASAAVAQCGIARTHDLKTWERLPDLVTNSGQQRNVVLHPEYVNRKYALYTRPQDGFISVGSGGGIGWGLLDDMAQRRGARGNRRRRQGLSYDQGSEERPGSGSAQDAEGLAAFGPWRAQYGGRASLCPLHVHDGARPALGGDPCAGRLFHRAGRRGASRRRFQCRLLERLDRQ